MKTIHITIEPSGEIQIEAVGFRGADCEQATAFLEKVLGTVSRKERKPEYYRWASVRTEQRVGS
jgi:hypothetical protein